MRMAACTYEKEIYETEGEMMGFSLVAWGGGGGRVVSILALDGTTIVVFVTLTNHANQAKYFI